MNGESVIRLTLKTATVRVKATIENLYGGRGRSSDVEELKAVLDDQLEIFQLNSHIVESERVEKSLQDCRKFSSCGRPV